MSDQHGGRSHSSPLPTPAPSRPSGVGSQIAVANFSHEYDVFISHASEDKQTVAGPLAHALLDHGLTVWLDELVLKLGDSLSRRIEAGLARCRFGVVVLSPAFFAKEWPRRELEGLAAREVADGTKVILPVWHNVDRRFLLKHAPILADRLGAPTSAGLPDVTAKILEALEHVEESHRTSESSIVKDPAPFQQRLESSSHRADLPGAPVASAPNRARGRPRWTAALAAAVAVPCGFIATSLVRHEAGSAEPLTASASNSQLDVSMPGTWRRTAQPTLAADFHPDAPLQLSASFSPAGRLTFGMEKTTSPTLLPQSLLENRTTPPRPEVVKLAAGKFYRYSRLRQEDSANVETVYALRTTAGVLVAVCTLPSSARGRVGRDCERIVDSAQLIDAKVLPNAPDGTYSRLLHETMDQLDSSLAPLERKLTYAEHASTQAAASQKLSSAYGHAAQVLQRASPGASERDVHERLLAALTSASKGYKEMTKGAQGQNALRFTRGSQEVTSSTRSLAKSTADFAALGYTPSHHGS